MTERFGFHVVPVHPGLITSDYVVHEVGITVCWVQHALIFHIPFQLMSSNLQRNMHNGLSAIFSKTTLEGNFDRFLYYHFFTIICLNVRIYANKSAFKKVFTCLLVKNRFFICTDKFSECHLDHSAYFALQITFII